MRVFQKTGCWIFILIVLLVAGILTACSVVSPGVREQAADLTFSELKENPAAYAGQTVILGGYVVSVENMEARTRLMVLQAPLDFQDQPKSREASQGRFLVATNDFLDPMVYEKGRKVTVGGTVLGETTENVGDYAYPMPEIKAAEIHLWEEWEKRRPYPYYRHDDPFYPWWDSHIYYRWHHPYRW